MALAIFSYVGRQEAIMQEARGFENIKVYRVPFKNQIGVLYLSKVVSKGENPHSEKDYL
ncbi:MAG: hypothetical protein HEQ20_03820 [Aphanizomenon flos-aquae KM1D3_PB]|uniref:hypothetical protein n=1 Tax=Aphanizomenon flos-aquae TaxID=1176 RepID=UPI001362BC78|nr:hypothetical protein [Aphanizomenon flos-aquae]QSV70045.1 MAG: hypothetical protein HEQ20_03820 [Aphanizomenon flos-aquae KM1D3_PB]